MEKIDNIYQANIKFIRLTSADDSGIEVISEGRVSGTTKEKLFRQFYMTQKESINNEDETGQPVFVVFVESEDNRAYLEWRNKNSPYAKFGIYCYDSELPEFSPYHVLISEALGDSWEELFEQIMSVTEKFVKRNGKPENSYFARIFDNPELSKKFVAWKESNHKGF